MENIIEGLNPQQKNAVTIDTNVVVAAGAGAGKTKVLAKRYVHLVTEKQYTVDRILALTFTEKAAAEMHERIYAELESIAAEDGSFPQVQRAKTAVQDFHRAQIMTLDSFCLKIAKTGCRQFGISPDFTIDIKESERLAYNLSLDFFLAHRKDPIIQYFLDTSSIKDFVTAFFVKLLQEYVTISRPLDLSAMLIRQEQEAAHRLEKPYRTFIEALDTLHALFSSDEAESVKNDTFFSALKAAYTALPPLPDSIDGEAFLDFLACFQTVAKTPANKGSKTNPLVKECKEHLQNVLRPVYSELLNAYNFYYHLPSLRKLYPLCDELQTLFITQKKQKSILTFSDVQHLAVDILRTDPDLRRLYKKDIARIMIDEFQDNNSLQRDLLFLLAENEDRCADSVPDPSDLCPDKLFFVGDEKQSIYAFRGADVSVFRALAEDLKTGHDEDYHLVCNYRTEPALLNLFNTVFSRVFYSEENRPESGPVPGYEAVFSPIESRAAVEGLQPQLELIVVDSQHFKDTPPEVTPIKLEAEAFAARIAELHRQKTPVYDDVLKTVRPCRWSDFAILMRTATHQAEYERFLRAAKIPAVSIQQKGLFDDAPLNDLYALLRLVVYPHDRYTYAQVLRSPLIAISDLSVAGILLHGSTPFDESILQEDGVVQEEDREYVTQACALFARLNTYKKTHSNAECITALWYDEGYRYILLRNPSYHRYLEFYDYMFQLALESDKAGQTLSDFVDLLGKYRSQNRFDKKNKIPDMEIPLDYTQDAVKIMSVHKSKGLEFPIVCIPDCGSDGQNEKKEDLVFFNSDLGILLHLPQIPNVPVQKNPIFEDCRTEANKKHLAETKRLLYVAMTRAKVRLLMSGIQNTVVPKNGKKTEPITDEPRSLAALQQVLPPQNPEKNMSFFDLLLPALPQTGYEVVCTEVLPVSAGTLILHDGDTTAHQSGNACKTAVYSSAALQAQYQHTQEAVYAPAIPQVIPVTQFEKDKKWTALTEQRQPFPQEESLSAAAFGTLVHKTLEARLLNKTFAVPERYRKEVHKLCEIFLTSPLGKKALAAAFIKTEYGFISSYQNRILTGQIDLLFEHEGTVYIVDYKTDTFEQPEDHRFQLTMYKQAVEQLYQLAHFGLNDSSEGKPSRSELPAVKAYIFYLRTGTAVEIV